MQLNQIHINPRLVQNVTVLLSVILLAWVLHEGYQDGRDIARSNLNEKNAQGVVDTLDIFFSDQSRYPTNKEFLDNSIMDRYADNFPPKYFITEICPNPSAYNSFNQATYTYVFCLERSTDNYPQGKSEVGK